jgi:hypothetical protein
MFPYIIANEKINLFIDNKPVVIDKSNVNYNKITEAIASNDWDLVKELSKNNFVNELYKLDSLTIDVGNNAVNYKNYQLPDVLRNTLLRLYKQNINLNYMLVFIDNLLLNPSYKTIKELYSFLEAGGLPITDDGHFLAYKKVNGDFTSIHDNKTRNDIGTVVKMDRNLCDDNSNNTCSTGLHFCSYDYLDHFGSGTNSNDRVIIVKVNPQHVTSVPTDYNNTKGRACEYLILCELGQVDLVKPFVDTTQYGLKSGPTTSADSIVQDEYLHGYQDGWKKLDILNMDQLSVSYHSGYRDGRGHKSKLKF